LPLLSNADPAVVFPLEFPHPLRSSIFSGAVSLEQCTLSGFEPQTRVFGYTPEAAKGRTHSSVHTIGAENVSCLAAVSITLIVRAERWTYIGIFERVCSVGHAGDRRQLLSRGVREGSRGSRPRRITSSLSDAPRAASCVPHGPFIRILLRPLPRPEFPAGRLFVACRRPGCCHFL
jgi:hypothetical protein